MAETLVTVWFPPVYNPLRKLPTGCEPSCDPRSEVSLHQAKLTATFSLNWNRSCFVWRQKHGSAVWFILVGAGFTSETAHSLSFLSCNTVDVVHSSSTTFWMFSRLFFFKCCSFVASEGVSSNALGLPVWAALPSLANKISAFCNKSLGLRCFLCEHSDGGQETLPIWPIYDTRVFFKAAFISSSPSDLHIPLKRCVYFGFIEILADIISCNSSHLRDSSVAEGFWFQPGSNERSWDALSLEEAEQARQSLLLNGK